MSATSAPGAAPRAYRYYDFVMAASVTVLLCSNFIGAAKQASVELPLLGATTFGAGVLFFPISYIFGDILTEVYGYGRDRRVVWAGFGALAFASLMAWVVISLPPAKNEFMNAYQGHLEAVFGNAWRIAAINSAKASGAMIVGVPPPKWMCSTLMRRPMVSATSVISLRSVC